MSDDKDISEPLEEIEADESQGDWGKAIDSLIESSGQEPRAVYIGYVSKLDISIAHLKLQLIEKEEAHWVIRRIHRSALRYNDCDEKGRQVVFQEYTIGGTELRRIYPRETYVFPEED